MRRLALTTLTMLLAGLLAAGSGTTAAGHPVNWTLAGAAEWSGSGFLAEKFSIHGVINGVGTYSGTLEAGPYFTTETCGPQCAPVTGTIDFVTRRGNLTATVAPEGLVTVVSIGSGTTYDFTLPLQILSGTRAYARASGSLSLSYSSHLPTNQPGCSVCPIEDAGTLTGMIARVRSAVEHRPVLVAPIP
jgi:hypothetical protein